ncbi:unnamed protein product [Eruca vesicaria subsp. sativa]|uniref:Uncharacterized protein n=1 Tax=Eruca vesicaria subsp. sativa TaxID=29727 RepID=A0ABC8L9B4_ERUVS|nr:unnamed protein product [Eruca vesicaria subsp. sativa]
MPLEESMISDIMPAFTCIAPFSSMYYKYVLETPFALRGSHNLTKVTRWFLVSSSETRVYRRHTLGRADNLLSKNADAEEVEKNLSFRESGPTSRVAILRDPDYDRSYKRYIRNLPLYQNFNLPPFNMMQSPNCQMGPISQELMSLNFRPPSSVIMSVLMVPQYYTNAAFNGCGVYAVAYDICSFV